jgi:hypothetical protein
VSLKYLRFHLVISQPRRAGRERARVNWILRGRTIKAEEHTMPGKRKILSVIPALLVAGAMTGIAKAADSDANLASGEYNTKQLLLLMDKDKNGKVSRKEFMDFMAAEFTRLDTNKNGELDVNELSQIHVGHSPGYRK